MAELFLANDNERGELVVVKRILPYLSQEAEFVQMFLDEAKIAAQLHHPNIIQVHELGILQDSYFISMEYLEGVDARKILQEEAKLGLALPYGIAAYITSQVCAGLGYAHTATGVDGRALGVIHRDVSPQNVMVAFDGKVKLVDFGIAKAGAIMERSKPGVIKGKFLYLSPEQLSQERLDHRADLFAVGTMLYELTTGKSPFYKATTEAVIYAIKTEEPAAPQSIRSDFPPEVARIIMKCLTKDRTKRYQSALEIKRDLDTFLKVTRPVEPENLASYVARLFGTEDDRTMLHVPPPLEERAKPPPPPGRREPTVPLPIQPPPPAEPPAPSGLPVGRRQTSEHPIAPQLDEEPPTNMSSPEEVVRLQARNVVPPPARRSGNKYPAAGADGEETDISQSSSNEPAVGTSEHTPVRPGVPQFSSLPPSLPSAPTHTSPGHPVFDATPAGGMSRVAEDEPSLTPEVSRPMTRPPEPRTEGDEDDENETAPSRAARPRREEPEELDEPDEPRRGSPIVFGLIAFMVVLSLGLIAIWVFREWMSVKASSWRRDAPHVQVESASPPAVVEEVRTRPAEPGPGEPEAPKPAGVSRVPLVFKAPKGTVLLHDGEKIPVNEPYSVLPGRFTFQYQCPGKHILINGSVEAAPQASGPLEVQLGCRIKH